MMNKGLELIEAARLFDLPETQVDVLIHQQSVVHGMVCYSDGSVLAQMGTPGHADPDRPCAGLAAASGDQRHPRLDLARVARLEFADPDPVRFPSLRLSRDALRAGGGAPTILNAANEVAVEAFLTRRIGFLAIAGIVEAVLERMGAPAAVSLEEVMALDGAARRHAGELVSNDSARPAA